MPKYYLLDENKNLVEGYDKEGFLALLEQAIENGDLENIDEDSAFVSKFKSLLNGTTHHLEFVTQAQYNQLVADEELQPNTYYFITDDTTLEGLEESLNQLASRLTTVEGLVQDIINGDQVVAEANHSTSSDNAEKTLLTNGSWSNLTISDAQTDITSLGLRDAKKVLVTLVISYANPTASMDMTESILLLGILNFDYLVMTGDKHMIYFPTVRAQVRSSSSGVSTYDISCSVEFPTSVSGTTYFNVYASDNHTGVLLGHNTVKLYVKELK